MGRGVSINSFSRASLSTEEMLFLRLVFQVGWLWLCFAYVFFLFHFIKRLPRYGMNSSHHIVCVCQCLYKERSFVVLVFFPFPFARREEMLVFQVF